MNVFFFFFFLGETVSIGDVSYKLKTPKNPELVPQNYSKNSYLWMNIFKNFIMGITIECMNTS